MWHSGPRNTEPFELDPEDFLPARPAPLTAERLLELEIDPAPWALLASCKIGGKRHEKRVQQYGTSKPVQQGSHLPIIPFEGAYGPFGPHTHFTPDEVDARERALKKHKRRGESGRGNANNTPSVYDGVPVGNLAINDDYRFWKGFATQHALKDDATCRWCGERCVGHESMRLHHTGKQNRYCKERLLALYKYAKTNFKPKCCFVCRQECGKNEYWGVPLCKRVGCISRWKFTLSYQLAGFEFYRDFAAEEQFRDPEHGPYAGLPAEPTSGISC